jgi:hypothetical protein
MYKHIEHSTVEAACDIWRTASSTSSRCSPTQPSILNQHEPGLLLPGWHMAGPIHRVLADRRYLVEEGLDRVLIVRLIRAPVDQEDGDAHEMKAPDRRPVPQLRRKPAQTA